MSKAYWLAAVCALALSVSPGLAAGPASNTSGGSAADSSSTAAPAAKTPMQKSTGHARRAVSSARGTSSQDNIADELNAESLQAIQQGRTFQPSGS
jgi:hypothetical protein